MALMCLRLQVCQHTAHLCVPITARKRVAQDCITQATISTEALEYPFACTTCVKDENEGILVHSDGVHMLLQVCAQQNSAGETSTVGRLTSLCRCGVTRKSSVALTGAGSPSRDRWDS